MINKVLSWIQNRGPTSAWRLIPTRFPNSPSVLRKFHHKGLCEKNCGFELPPPCPEDHWLSVVLTLDLCVVEIFSMCTRLFGHHFCYHLGLYGVVFVLMNSFRTNTASCSHWLRRCVSLFFVNWCVLVPGMLTIPVKTTLSLLWQKKALPIYQYQYFCDNTFHCQL